MQAVTIVLAISSPLMRARMLSALRQCDGLIIIGEAATGVHAADLVAVSSPHFILCDRMMLADPDLAEAMTFPGRRPQAVMLAVNNERVPTQAAVKVEASVSYLTKAGELLTILREIREANEALSRASRGPKFDGAIYHFTQRRQVSTSAETAPRPAAPQDSHIAKSMSKAASTPKVRLASALLALQLNPWQYPLDPVTGMVGATAMARALEILTEIQHVAAFMEIEIRSPLGMELREETADAGLVRTVAMTIRATVRHYDLLCRTGPASFTLLIPDLARAQADQMLQQLRLSLVPVGLAFIGEDGPMQIEIGSSVWQPGSAPSEALLACRRSIPGKPPAPTKTAQLARTSFFKSVFDIAPGSGVALNQS